MSQQVMRITGELQIDAIGGYRELKGEVSFLGPNSYKYGRIRVYGSSGFYSFINDVTGCSQGFNVRTLSNQGDSQVGGTNNQFPFSVVNQEIRGMFINIDQKLQGQNVLFNGLPNLQINRNSTADTTSLTNSIGTFTQTQWKANENNQILVGFSPFFGYSTFGYYSPSASGTNITTNEGYVGIWNNGNMIKTIKWRPDGTVEIPLQLNVDTINATNYLNIPSTDLTPIHLDKVNNSVGINNTSPVAALDVVGSINTNRFYRIDNEIFVARHATDSVAVGQNAASTSQSTRAVAIGSSAGTSSQGQSAIAIGYLSGNTGQSVSAIAIGASAGQTNQRVNSISIGMNAGNNTQGENSVAIGNAAGRTTQGKNSVAIGIYAGDSSQGIDAIAIGHGAGNGGQGVNSIAIGKYAGMTNQHSSSIIMNATGSALESTSANSFYVKPIRSLIDANSPRLHYNATTGEICYGDSTTNSLLPMTLDKTNNRVGIDNTSPDFMLDVNGDICGRGNVICENSLKLPGIAQAQTPKILFYNETTKEVTYGTDTAVTPIVFVSQANNVGIDDLWANYCATNLTPGVYTATLNFYTPDFVPTEKPPADYYFEMLCLNTPRDVAQRRINIQSTLMENGHHQVIDTISGTFKITIDDTIVAKVRRFSTVASTVTLRLTVTKHT